MKTIVVLTLSALALVADSKLAQSITDATQYNKETGDISVRTNKLKAAEIAVSAKTKLSVNKVNFTLSKLKELKSLQ